MQIQANLAALVSLQPYGGKDPAKSGYSLLSFAALFADTLEQTHAFSNETMPMMNVLSEKGMFLQFGSASYGSENEAVETPAALRLGLAASADHGSASIVGVNKADESLAALHLGLATSVNLGTVSTDGRQADESLAALHLGLAASVDSGTVSGTVSIDGEQADEPLAAKHLDSAASAELGTARIDGKQADESLAALHLGLAASVDIGTVSIDGEQADESLAAKHLDSAASAESGNVSINGDQADAPLAALHLDLAASAEFGSECSDDESEANDLQAVSHLGPSLTMEMQAAPKETPKSTQQEVILIDFKGRLEAAESQSRNTIVQEAEVGEEVKDFAGYHIRKAGEKPLETGKDLKQFTLKEEWDFRAEDQQFKFRAERMKNSESQETSELLVSEKAAFSARTVLETSAGIYSKENVERAAVLDQVLEKMVVNKDVNGESKVFIRLKPAVLGEVEIRLRMENGQLSGSILAQNAQVKEVLETALAQLKHRLEAQQIQVAELTVTVGQEQDFHQGRDFMKTPWEQSKAANIGALTADGDEMPLATVMMQGLIDARA